MTDGSQPERPNSKYKLSRSDDVQKPDEEGLAFHYSRERRLANAPKEVQDLYKEQKKGGFGLFTSLIADKPRRTLFVIIILLCAAILILSATGYFDTFHSLDGNRIDITGTSFEGITIISIKKTVRNTEAYSGAVDIAVSVPVTSDDFPVFYHRIFFTLEKEEMYRFSVPFDSPELLVVLQSERNTTQLKLIPE